MNLVIYHLNFNSKHDERCKFALKLILMGTTSNLFSLKLYKNANIANFIYYGKTGLAHVFMEFSVIT